MDVYEEVAGMFGISQDDIARTDDRTLNNFARGARLVNFFDEDKIQGVLDGFGDGDLFDLTPGDFQVPYTAGNVAVGAAIAQAGVTSDKEGTLALRTYLKDLKPASGLSDRDMIVNVGNLEQFVAGMYRTPSGQRPPKYQGLSRAKIREEAVEDFILKLQEQQNGQ
jgi:hypothetical protein